MVVWVNNLLFFIFILKLVSMLIDKDSPLYPSNGGVTVNKQVYKPDYLIELPTEDSIDFKDCICVFSIIDRQQPPVRKYVGAKYFNELDNQRLHEPINGYLPEYVFCFTETSFPLEEFESEQNFKPFK